MNLIFIETKVMTRDKKAIQGISKQQEKWQFINQVNKTKTRMLTVTHLV